jgi:multidrug resistance protein, MATE family
MTADTSKLAWSETRAVARTSGPFVTAYATENMMYLTDMAIVGRLGVAELAGAAQAEQIVFLLISVLGTLMSFTSVAIANAIGAGDSTRAVHVLQQGLLIAVALAIPATLVAWNIGPLLASFGVDAEVVSPAGAYGRGVAWCVFPYLLFILLRAFLAAVDRPRAVFTTTVAAVVVNAALCYALTFGLFGFPGFGVAGAGMATSIVTALIVLSLAVSIHRSPPLPGLSVFRFRPAIDLSVWSNVFRKGTPASVAAILEDSLFVAAAVAVGSFGVVALAAHYVASTIVNLGILVANGIGDAAAIRVAVHRGRGSLNEMRVAGYSGVALCTFAMMMFAMAMLVAPTTLSSIFVDTDQPQSAEVVVLTAQLFLIAAVAQFVEGIQVVTMRALRGLEDTLVPLLIAVCGYWLLAFPAGLGLAYLGGLGLNGMWLGLACGLASTAIALLWRYNRLTLGAIRKPYVMTAR